jgi:hypothetical protein
MRKMNRKTIITLTILIIGILAFLKLNSEFLLLWNSNNVSVETESPLTNEKVKIEFGISVNTINRPNDTELFSDRNKYSVIYNGKKENEIFNEYGENDFLITYGNEFYYSFRQFKFNRRNQHNYNFKFLKQANVIVLKVSISGKDGIGFERKMLKIKDAENYVCNTPIDSIGTVYNMIDLKKK